MTKNIGEMFYLFSGYTDDAHGTPVAGSKNEVPLDDVKENYVPTAVRILEDWIVEDIEVNYTTMTTDDVFLDTVLANLAIFVATMVSGLEPYSPRDGTDERNIYLQRAEELILNSSFGRTDREGRRVVKGFLEDLVASHVLGKTVRRRWV